MHADFAARFPNAEITACNLSDMANAISPYRDKLPVVTQEIGDTWIHGIASDPLKVARFREVARLRERWIELGGLRVGSTADLQLLRHLLLEPEHTWGTDTKTGSTLITTSLQTWRACWIQRSTRWWSSAGLRSVRTCWMG